MKTLFQPCAALRLLPVLALICLAGGCASSNPGGESADGFEAGAGREPNAKTLYAMARMLVDKGRDRDAITLLNMAVEKAPTFAPAYNELAGIYIRSDRSGDAVEVLTTGLKHAPGDAVLLNNLGMCHFLRQDFENANLAFAAAVAVVPNSAQYRANQAAALAMLGRADDAAAAYDGVISDDAAKQNLALFAEAHGRLHPAAPCTQPSTQPAEGERELIPAAQSKDASDVIVQH